MCTTRYAIHRSTHRRYSLQYATWPTHRLSTAACRGRTSYPTRSEFPGPTSARTRCAGMNYPRREMLGHIPRYYSDVAQKHCLAPHRSRVQSGPASLAEEPFRPNSPTKAKRTPLSFIASICWYAPSFWLTLFSPATGLSIRKCDRRHRCPRPLKTLTSFTM